MKNSIKINRALKIVGMLPMQRCHILGNIPDSVKDALTSAQLAELMVAMHKHFSEGVAQGEKEINDYVGLPAKMSLWDVIGDDHFVPSSGDPRMGDRVKFSDGLRIPDVLERRVRELKK